MQTGRPALNTGTLFCKCPSNPTPYFTIRVRKPGRATDAYSEMNRNAASLDELAPLDLASASDYRQLVTPRVLADVFPQYGGEVTALGRYRSRIRLVRVCLEVGASHLADGDERSGDLRLLTEDCPDQARKLRGVVGRVRGYGADRRGHLAIDRGFHGEPSAPDARHHGPKRGGCATGDGSALDQYDHLLGNLKPIDLRHDIL